MSSRHRAICRAGGEHTISGGSNSLFPDVLLFGDEQRGMILQGWELKFPDTPVSDPDLIKNASDKARRLRLGSFLLWNVREAVLYCQRDDGRFIPERQWSKAEIGSRSDVADGRSLWVELLHEILAHLNDFFEQRPGVAATVPNILQDVLFTEFVRDHAPQYASAITLARRKSAALRAQIDAWWEENRSEFPGAKAEQALAVVNILNWLNKFIFAHCLRSFRKEACAVDSIKAGATVEEAERVFAAITSKCDFMAVFRGMLGEACVDPETWRSLTALNALLADSRLNAVSPGLLAETLSGAVERSRRKIFGQFGTPPVLAELLARVAIDDIGGIIMDPCCGSGTIVRAVYDWKKSENISPGEALKQIWAGDKFAFPLQLATMALADPSAIGNPLNVFCRDALNLSAGDRIQLTNPNTGEQCEAIVPQADAIISNLPFVRFEALARQGRTHSGMCSRGDPVRGGSALDSKSDLFALLMTRFPVLLHPGSRVGVIVANSWLGTEWARSFRGQLQEYFRILTVVTSASKRWFKSAAVVANIVVLERRDNSKGERAAEKTCFVSIAEPIEKWREVDGGVEGLARRIVQGSQAKTAGYLRAQTLTGSQITELGEYGIQWASFFADLGFMSKVKQLLIPANTLFNINRGERRGWDRLFFPPTETSIEPQFLHPVLKNSRNLRGLIAAPDARAFCCSLSLRELHQGRFNGAIDWINQFAKLVNDSGRPLPEVLGRTNCHWYEMKPSTMADFAIPINPDSRLCVFRLRERAFVNQRLIRFSLKEINCSDVDLIHSLLNSSLGMFLIEAAGFGRGLGVLDLNAGKLKRSFHVLILQRDIIPYHSVAVKRE